MPAKKKCTAKRCGRRYTSADLASNRRNQKKRVQLNRENRRRGTYGNGDGKDLSHGADGSLVQESKSKNRSRNGKDGKSTLRRKRRRRRSKTKK